MQPPLSTTPSVSHTMQPPLRITYNAPTPQYHTLSITHNAAISQYHTLSITHNAATPQDHTQVQGTHPIPTLTPPHSPPSRGQRQTETPGPLVLREAVARLILLGWAAGRRSGCWAGPQAGPNSRCVCYCQKSNCACYCQRANRNRSQHNK